MRSKFEVEKEETIFERGKAPSEAMSGRVTYTTAAAILYAGLTAGVLGEDGCLKRRVSVDDVIRNCTHDCVVTVIEGSEPVVNKKKGPLRQCAGKTLGTHAKHLVTRCDFCHATTGVFGEDGCL